MYLTGIENDGTYTKNANCCAMCKRAVINSGIKYVIVKTPDGFNQIDTSEWVTNDDSLSFHEGY
jgi:dCMP deaminase